MYVFCMAALLAMAGGPVPDGPPVPPPEKPSLAALMGLVTQTTNASNYTYVEVESGGERIWAAAPVCDVKVGDRVMVPPGIPMKNFQSARLGRTFEEIFFVDGIRNLSAAPSPHGDSHAGVLSDHNRSTVALAEGDFSGIDKPADGKTVAEVHAQRKELAGKEVTVAGKVVKFTPSVMGRNWVHLQDGSGSGPDGDLTITTTAQVAVDDVVTIRGDLAVDRDFGYGYKYGVIIENAVLVETPTAEGKTPVAE